MSRARRGRRTTLAVGLLAVRVIDNFWIDFGAGTIVEILE